MLGSSALVLAASHADAVTAPSSPSVGTSVALSVIGGPPVAAGSPTDLAMTPDGTRAYVVNGEGCTVEVIDLATNRVIGPPIVVGSYPGGVAITPNGARAYVTNTWDWTVSVIDLSTNTVIGRPIPVGRRTLHTGPAGPTAVAITRDGSRAYVSIPQNNAIATIDVATNRVVGAPIAVGAPGAVAMTRDGAHAYAPIYVHGAPSWIDLVTNRVISPIPAGELAITPDGARACVVSQHSISVFDLATNLGVGSPIVMGASDKIHEGVAIAPDGARAYVTTSGNGTTSVGGTVTVIDLATNLEVGDPIVVGNEARDPQAMGVAITPDGARAYVALGVDGAVAVIDLATNTVVGAPIAVGHRLPLAERRVVAAERLGHLQSVVADLVASGALDRGTGRSLRKRIGALHLDVATPCPRCEEGPGFYNHELLDRLMELKYQVNRLIDKGALTPAHGQPLIDAASVVMAELNR